MFEKFLNLYYRKVYPGRKIEVKRIKNTTFIKFKDYLGNANYLLQDTYNFDQIQKINEKTKYSARYGYCPQIGPVAIIGIPDSDAIINYFSLVSEYGKVRPSEEFELHNYTLEEAKQVANYNVFGLKGFELICNDVKFKAISFFEDSRYKIKTSDEYRILNMDAKFDGLWSYETVKKMVQQDEFSSYGNLITFAIVGDNKTIAIIGLFTSQKLLAKGFRDVWEYEEQEPKIESIRFLSEDEASEIKNFTIYFYEAIFPIQFRNCYYKLILDRTINPKFNFFDTQTGQDMRLTELKDLYRTSDFTNDEL